MASEQSTPETKSQPKPEHLVKDQDRAETKPEQTVKLENYEAISSYHDKLVDWLGSMLNLWSILITSLVAVGGIAIPFFINLGYEKRLQAIEKGIEERFQAKVQNAVSRVDGYKTEAMSIQLQLEAFHFKDDSCITAKKRRIEKYNQLISLEPLVAKHRFNRGTTNKQIYEENKEINYRECAIKDFDKAIELDPTDDEPYYNRGVCYETFPNYEKALSDFGNAIKHDPHKVNYYLSKAKALSQLLRFKEAHDVYKYVEENFQASKECFTQKAETYIIEGELYKAQKTLRTILQSEPYNTVVLKSLMDIALKLCKYDESKNYADKIAIYDLNNYDALVGKIKIAMAKQEYSQAKKLCNKAIKTVPHNYLGYYLRGEVHTHLDSFQEALADFNAAIRYEKNKTKTYNALACLYEKNDDNEACLDYWQRAIELNSTKLGAYLGLARYYMNRKQWGDATKQLQKVFELQSNNAEALTIHTLIIQQSYKLEEEGLYRAIKEYESWICKVKDWDNYEGLYNLSEAYSMIGQYELAIKTIERAIKYCPYKYKAITHQQYAYYHYKLGRAAKALELLEKK